MVKSNETSEGLLLHAKEFLIAAECLLNNKTPDIQNSIQFPIYFLLGRSIELSLKAFLLSQGMTSNQVKNKKFGHNIITLFVEAQNRNLQNEVTFSSIEVGVIQVLNIDYSSKRLEYRNTGGMYHIPNIADTENIARKLVHDLQTICNTA